MYTKWTQNLPTDEAKLDFAQQFKNATPVLDRLNEILLDMERDVVVSEIKGSAYDNPNWAYRQAHSNGYRQCLNHIKNLVYTDPNREKSDQ